MEVTVVLLLDFEIWFLIVTNKLLSVLYVQRCRSE